MINGKCPTWFVVKWLENHPTHTAKAPDSHDMWPCTASTDGMHFGFKTDWPPEYGFEDDNAPPHRSDWTIYNERGKRVRFRKREPRLIVPPFGTLTVRSGTRTIEVLKALNATLDVFIRERKP